MGCRNLRRHEGPAHVSRQKDGGAPHGTLIAGRGGALFGTTTGGGSYGQGTVFKLREDGTEYRTLHSFPESPQDGRNPLSGPIEGADGFLYGSTESGGLAGLGTIFKISSDGKDYTLLYSFPAIGREGLRAGQASAVIFLFSLSLAA